MLVNRDKYLWFFLMNRMIMIELNGNLTIQNDVLYSLMDTIYRCSLALVTQIFSAPKYSLSCISVYLTFNWSLGIILSAFGIKFSD